MTTTDRSLGVREFSVVLTVSVLHTFSGDNINDTFGRSVAGAGDVNGDGFDDLIVGAPGDDNNGSYSGSARVFSGLDGSVIFTFDGSPGDRLGTAVAGVGDLNQDGFTDLAVSAPFNDTNGADAGQVSVFSGADGSVLHSTFGDSSGDQLGSSVSRVGDVNGDGIGDLITGAIGDDDHGSNSGSARLINGSDGSSLNTFLGDAELDQFGRRVSGAGDVNGDGLADLVVSAPYADNNGSSSGTVRVFASSPDGFIPMSGQAQPFPFVGIGGRDDDLLSGIIVSIDGPRSAAGTDQIVAPRDLPPNVFSAGFNRSAGNITFTGLAPVNVYEQLLRDLRVAPSAFGGARSLSVTVIDSGGRLHIGPVETGVGTATISSNSFDFGDAPDTFGTTIAADGARHQYSDLFLGDGIDIDIVPTPNADATGDDLSGGFGNDDDAIVSATAIARGQGGSIQVVASGSGTLAAWIDFDHSGTFDEPSGLKSTSWPGRTISVLWCLARRS